MKAGLLSIAALSAVALAQPQHGAHRHRHAKKQAVEYVTEVSTVTAAANEVVYVDQYGNKINGQQAQATSAPAPAPAAYSAPPQEYQPPAPASSQAPAYSAPAYSAPAPSSTQAAQSAAPSSYSGDDSSSDDKSGHGISYSPYNADKSCKTKDQIDEDINALEGYTHIRMYGVDCDQVGPIVTAAKNKNMKVMAGIFNIHDVENEAKTLAQGVNGDWSAIEAVSVGNEGVNNGQYSVGDVKYAVDTAKSCLSGEGYDGPVVTVDTFIAIINNPGLCDVGDFVAANCHAFFDGGVTAEKSGKWVLEQAQRVSEACGGKRTVITEAGWPSKGSPNGKAVPSMENQKAAVQDLKDNFTGADMYLFTAYNGYWKDTSGDTYGVEHYWGVYGDCPSEQ